MASRNGRGRYTLYVDETGAFKQTASSGEVGVRAVLGLLLAGSASHHERELAPRLRRAFGWYAGPPHACEVKLAKLAVRLGACRPLRGEFARLEPARARLAALPVQQRPGLACSDGPLRLELLDEVRRIHDAVCELAGAALDELGGAVVVALEARGAPRDSRYPAMARAAVEAAAASLVSQDGSHALDLIVEQGATGWQELQRTWRADLDGIEGGLRAARGSLGLDGGVSCGGGFFPKGRFAGLVLADFLAYWLFPSDLHLGPLPAASLSGMHVGPLRRRLFDFLGARARATFVDAAEPFRLLQDALRRKTSAGEARPAMEALRGAPPPFVLPATCENGVEILVAWNRMGL